MHKLKSIILIILFMFSSFGTHLYANNKSISIKSPIAVFQYKPAIFLYYRDNYSYKIKETRKGKNCLLLTLENDFFNQIFTEELVDEIYAALRKQLPKVYASYALSIFTEDGVPIEQYVPNAWREKYDVDTARYPNCNHHVTYLTPLSKPYTCTQGLANKNISLLNSHGLFYDVDIEQWKWQRPRLFGTVEDLLSTAIAIPYLLPMLENAGANVLMPRERDIQREEKVLEVQKIDESNVIYRAQVSKEGWYTLSCMYVPTTAPSTTQFQIHHTAGSTSYELNTQIGGGSWQYLGKHYLKEGVEVKVHTLVADFPENLQVRIGGGMSKMGNGYPSFKEAARYYLQHTATPDSILYDQKEGVISDYYDDIYARAKWVNYLMGGSHNYPNYPGLGIPVDASISLHTDAGIMPEDSLVGSLVLCTSDSVYASGYSRMAGHDFASIMSSQLQQDLSSIAPEWPNRGIWHRQYVETRIPSTPSLIVELLSHQNLNDLKYGFDPKFQFTAARSIYKATLKFLAHQESTPYVVQPLPVTHFSVNIQQGKARLKWRAVVDPIEPTAVPTSFVVYTRIGKNGFDNGRIVDADSAYLPILQDSIYSFKVSALNEGGESFPSEILSLCSKTAPRGSALLINGFDRLEGPLVINNDSMAGFDYSKDVGVPYHYHLSFTGDQYNFDPASVFENNEDPGFGASNGDYETEVIAGNSFDYPYLHGAALVANGYSFASTSKLAVMDGQVPLDSYGLLDVILGKQKSSGTFQLLPFDLQRVIHDFSKQRKSIIVSGAYIGSDVSVHQDPTTKIFVEKVLRYQLNAPWASEEGSLVSEHDQIPFWLQMTPSEYRCFLQNVDAIQPDCKIGEVLMRYGDNNLPAAVGFKRYYGVVAAGFPIEALESMEQQSSMMGIFLDFLEQ